MMMNPMPADEASLRELAEQKEREWKQLQDLRAQTLEAAIQRKDEDLREEHERFLQLKDDFKYNLQLLQDRDEELDKYEINMQELRRAASEDAALMSELQIRVADLEEKVAVERRVAEEAQAHYQARLREKHDDMEQYRMARDSDLQKEREDLEVVKRGLERRLSEMEADMDAQRTQLGINYDEALKKREHEAQVKRDEINNQLLAAELKTKLLQKELEVLTKTHEETSQEFTQVAENHRQLEKQLKEKTWELRDVGAMKDARIRDLERELEKSQQALNRIREDYERKHESLDKQCRSQEQMSEALRQARDESERHLADVIRDLEQKVTETEILARNKEQTHKETVEDRDRIIECLRDELHQTKVDCDRQITELSKSTVHRDVRLQTATSDVDKLRADLEQRRADIERYKRDLESSLEREASLEKARAQLDLDWSRRYEQVESEQYNRVEELVRKLTTSRDQALSDLRQREAELSHQVKLSQVLMRDRDQALATLKHHGFAVDTAIQLESVELMSATAQRELDNLREQNQKLKQVIGLMREEMEKLGQPGGEPHKETVPVLIDRDSEYVLGLEREVQALKSRARTADLAAETADEVTEEKVQQQIGDNHLIRSHVQALNDQIGCLRREKVEFSAQIKKLQMQIEHMQAFNNQLSHEPRQKQVEVDQLQYELGAQSRRHLAEVTALRHQVAQLQLELSQSRKEADEYYKGTLERNLEATSLGNEVSALKMQLAQKQTNIAYGGQELLIQQLQDQISHLRQRYGEPATSQAGGEAVNKAAETALRHKLQQAALYIQTLAKEKQQLIEVGNRLRAELVKAGVKLPLAPSKQSVRIVAPPASPNYSAPPTKQQAPPTKLAPPTAPKARPIDESPPVKQSAMSDVIRDKLGQLEKLQYNLTKQELSFAQKGPQTVPVIGGSSDSTPDSNIIGISADLAQTGSTVRAQLTSSPSHGGPYGSDPRGGDPLGDPRHSLGISLSSVGGDSGLTDLWRMVDEGPSELTARLETTRIDPPALAVDRGPVAWAVRGQSAASALRPNKPVLSARAAGKVRAATSNKLKQRNTKIRNYNVRD